MTRPVVAVMFGRDDLTTRWVELLTARLPRCVVVDHRDVDPERVEILVVDNPPGSEVAAFENVVFVQSSWAGVDRLVDGLGDVTAARMVSPALGDLISEFALTCALMAHRGILEYRRLQSEGVWRQLPVVPPADRRVGVLGYGELGERVASSLAAHGFDVMAWARRSREAPVPVLSGAAGWDELFARSDIVVNLLPLTSETEAILDRDAFRRMGPGTTLVNLGRGAHVVDEDLLAALDAGEIGDAILDVFVEEPLAAGHPYWDHPRVTVIPHVAGPSRPDDLADLLAENVVRFLAGDLPRWLVASPGR